MSKTYSKFEHTHVMIRHPDNPDRWNMPHAIILHTGAHVWIAGDYSMKGHAAVLQVGIGGPTSTAYDEDGNCVLAVPAGWCTFYSPEEADGIAQCIDADERLLSYAR